MTLQLDEKSFIPVNGVQQGMFIQSVDTNNPVLLVLHGGPGSPEFAFNSMMPTGLEELFTVCWWEQRGSGISFKRSVKNSLTMEQMIDDAIVVTNYLRGRFGKEKIYVMGHSWGSLLGVLTIQRHPERFHAYMGIGQVARQDESERLAYRYMVDAFREAGDKRMVRKLEKHQIDLGGDISLAYIKVRSQGMQKLGIGMTRQMQSMADAVKLVLGFKGYTWREKINFTRGSALSVRCLWDDVLLCDLPCQAPRLEVPVYVFQGLYDYQVSYTLAKEYIRGLEAPLKGFYTFENSAHSPIFEEPEKMRQIISQDVLQGATSLADSPHLRQEA